MLPQATGSLGVVEELWVFWRQNYTGEGGAPRAPPIPCSDYQPTSQARKTEVTCSQQRADLNAGHCVAVLVTPCGLPPLCKVASGDQHPQGPVRAWLVGAGFVLASAGWGCHRNSALTLYSTQEGWGSEKGAASTCASQRPHLRPTLC